MLIFGYLKYFTYICIAMKKYVIYNMSTKAIVRLTNQEPDFKNMADDEDFDTVERWMSVDSGKAAIEAYMVANPSETPEPVSVVKPKVKLVGQDSNVFNLLAICTKALKQANQADKAKELTEKVFNASSFDDALYQMTQYCDVH